MRRLLFGVLFGVLFLSVSPAAVAEEISVSQKITVKAVVEPFRYIIVSSNGEILEVGSNTSDNVSPKVFIGSVSSKPQPLSPGLSQKYNFILASSPKKIGVIYKANPVATEQTKSKLALNLQI